MDGEVVTLSGSLGLASSRANEFRCAAAHLGKLLGESPVPAGLCHKLLEIPARRAIQGRGPLVPTRC